MIDTDSSGQITFEELKTGLKRVGANLKESEIYDLMQAVRKCIGRIFTFHCERAICSSCECLLVPKLQADVDNSGTIDYGEFIAAMLHLNKIEREDHLFAAFSYFDRDGSGYITADELQQACEEFGIEDARLEEMIQDVDQDNVSGFPLQMGLPYGSLLDINNSTTVRNFSLSQWDSFDPSR